MVEQYRTNTPMLIVGVDRKLSESGRAGISCLISDEERNNGNEFILPERANMITFGIIFYFYVFGRFVGP